MKLWRGLLLLLEVSFVLAATDDAGLCESTDKGGMCRSSPGEALFVDGAKLQAQIDELATFSDTPAPTVTRVLFTPNDVQARKYVKSLMSEAGLSIREDAIGNIFGRWEGSEPSLPAVGSGSHTDAIPYAGKYDGVLGVLGAIQAIQSLQKVNFQPKRAIEAVMFTSEEPTRFGFGCLGSRAMGKSGPIFDILRAAKDNENISFVDAAKAAGYTDVESKLEESGLSDGAYSAFVELHIEQGPLLEKEGIPIGVVTAIAAPASLKVAFQGDGGHAGAMLMPDRNDAGLAGAELALAVEEHVLASGSVDTVGTTGVLQIHPGAVNSIPREARLEIDVRDIDLARRDKVVAGIRASAEAIAKRRNVRITNFEIVNQDPPAQSGEKIVQAARQAAESLGLEYKLMISRAYHDSLFMARIAPMGMIFVPCYKGYSHRPDEFSSVEDMTKGVQVLALTLANLSSA
jgi:ureidoglycolate amidohydrolase